MGDRTTVTLKVLDVHATRVADLLGCLAEESRQKAPYTCLTYYDVNYGCLGFESDLAAAGIAYDKRWEDGDTYGAGTETCRFTPTGECVVNTVYDAAGNPELADLLAHIDQPEALRATILAHRDKVTPLPWDRQAEYGKLYCTRQLIAPAAPAS
jgi:hypothetical protein